LLEDVVEIYKKTKNVELYVEAHTDSSPINSKEIPTNWELSALRAVSVVRFFNEESKVDGFLLHGVGRGDSIPLFPNNSKINKMRNRRVEFIFSTIKKGLKN
jgi:chemotaxis protein MotB